MLGKEKVCMWLEMESFGECAMPDLVSARICQCIVVLLSTKFHLTFVSTTSFSYMLYLNLILYEI